MLAVGTDQQGDKQTDNKGDSPAHADNGAASGAGWSGTTIAAAAGAEAVLVTALVFFLVRRRIEAAGGPSGYPAESSTTRRSA
ncbi:hypothetical protein ACIQ7Q_06230 [Streptomyces sp. NPDC096176]|uniref:hypothetical protein n=1 Tax=Streptomyces sp. NPDC096176 TaxID=3366079 RepID=UPI0037FC0EFA